MPRPASLRPVPAAALLAALLLLAPGARAAPEPSPSPPPPPEAIDRAIEAGATWLLGEQDARGTFGGGSDPLGPTALAAFALLHAGVREGARARAARGLERALRWLDREGPGLAATRPREAGTYAAALLLLALRERGRAQDRPRMQRLADQVAGGQARNGQWGYQVGGGPPPDTGDNSNAQFALLALGAAAAEGLTVGPAALARARAWWREAQQPDGGFGYSSGGSRHSASTGSMTAAGIACLALLDAAEGRPSPDPALGPALAHLTAVFRPDRNPGPVADRVRQRQRAAGRGWLHYYLWTVERALVLAGHERLGETDWYAAGAAHLIATQHKDGSWRGERPLYATCFALLFLTRAADPPRAFTPRAAPPRVTTPRPEALPAGETPAEAPAQAPAPLGREAAAQAVAGWLAQEEAAATRAARCRAGGPWCTFALVRALDLPDRAARRRAFETLHELLPPERLRGVDRHPLARGRLEGWVRRELCAGRDQ